VHDHADCAAEITKHGHEVGNHTWSHLNLTQQPDDVVRDEIMRTERAIVQPSGQSPRPRFRVPYGRARRSDHLVARRRSQHRGRVTCHYFESSRPGFPTRHRFKTLAMKIASSSRTRAGQRLIRTILVPVDFSDCSLAGVKFAVRFAQEVGARIIVLHVTDLGPVMMTTA